MPNENVQNFVQKSNNDSLLVNVGTKDRKDLKKAYEDLKNSRAKQIK